MFMLKYDYHNVKALVKSMGANTDASGILSSSGRVSSKALTEAFITGDRKELPAGLQDAMSEGVGTLSRTLNPQISDINADKHYFAELSELALSTGDTLITGYARLLIDSANLRTFARVSRAGKTREFLENALIGGGNVQVRDILELYPDGDGLEALFGNGELVKAAALAKGVISGGAQTQFELGCDNAVRTYADRMRFVPFGKSVLLKYLLAVDWEMTAIRMILSGRLLGVQPDTIRERMREAYV
jgi:V/A-type H+-transporting ATPase subunit C